jgi:hypothetical protein
LRDNSYKHLDLDYDWEKEKNLVKDVSESVKNAFNIGGLNALVKKANEAKPEEPKNDYDEKKEARSTLRYYCEQIDLNKIELKKA